MIWSEPEKYKKHILIGTFHCCGAYLKAVGKRYCHGSGWTEIALEANLITKGSMSGVIDGKNWDRAMNTHKSMLEALERLLYNKFLETHEPLSPQGNASLERMNLSESSLAEVLSSADVTVHIAKYQELKQSVRNGELGRNCSLLDGVHRLHLACYVTEQRNQNK